jgi:nitrogen fixation NifU-like protein
MSEANLAALYQEMILDHYRRPRNKGELEHPDASVDMKNPLCGDEISVQLTFEGNVIRDIKFTGRGCSISQASASMMTELVKGKDAAEAELLREQFRAMVMGDTDAATNPMLGKARALSGVAKYPARVKCALLGWNALEAGIHRYEEASGNESHSTFQRENTATTTLKPDES